ncbi:MAG TPA: hypothetical protein VF493_22280 [Terriglobales bacterium]
MKKLWLIVLLLVAQMWPEEVKTFQGEIADNQCALNVHSLTRSHKEMLKGKAMGDTSQSCSQMCVKRYGGHYVLQDKNDVFNLDDQNQAAKFAGARVNISGALLPNNTIHVISIQFDKRP